MKRHKNGEGLGGGLALVLTIFVGIVMPYITSDEVGKLYEHRGQPKPVSALTGLWYFPGIVHRGRTDHLVRQDQQRAQRLLGLARRSRLTALARVPLG